MRTAEVAQGFYRHCQARGLAPKTLAFYHYALDPLAERFPILPEDPGTLEEYLRGLGIGAESRHVVWRALRRFYRVVCPRLDLRNPMEQVDAPTRRRQLPRALAMSQVQRLLACCQTPQERAMVLLILDTGLRLGELAGLRRPDVGDTAILLEGKTGQREVPISPATGEALADVGDGDILWLGRQGPLTRSGVEQAVRKLLARAGFRPPKAGPHMLRHTFGRLYIMAGGDVFSLQRILGHRDVSTTMIYVHLDGRDLAHQHSRFSPVQKLLEQESVRR